MPWNICPYLAVSNLMLFSKQFSCVYLIIYQGFGKTPTARVRVWLKRASILSIMIISKNLIERNLWITSAVQ
jgi:hypothetical protein